MHTQYIHTYTHAESIRTLCVDTSMACSVALHGAIDDTASPGFMRIIQALELSLVLLLPPVAVKFTFIAANFRPYSA